MFLGEINFLFKGGIGESIIFYNKEEFLKELRKSFCVGKQVSYKVYRDN